jgi:8-oxo-dGTP pyrophosphatase MutT (NUDIX family)
MTAQKQSDEEYFASLPRKTVGAFVLLTNEAGQLLVVNPNYKPDWSLPGGSVDEHESPRTAALREAKEEVGIALNTLSLAAIEYTTEKPPRSESLQFVFDGGVLTPDQCARIVLQTEELSEYRFVDVTEAIGLLNERQGPRIQPALEARKRGGVAYLEDSREVL